MVVRSCHIRTLPISCHTGARSYRVLASRRMRHAEIHNPSLASLIVYEAAPSPVDIERVPAIVRLVGDSQEDFKALVSPGLDL